MNRRTSQRTVKKLYKELEDICKTINKTSDDILIRAKTKIKESTGCDVSISPYRNNCWTISWFSTIAKGCLWLSINTTAEDIVDALHLTIIPKIKEVNQIAV